MIKVLILGATGYTGLELIRILSCHPEVTVTAGSSRNYAGRKVSDILPYVPKHKDFPLYTLENILSAPEADLAFLALPHGDSACAIRPLLDAGLKVVDLSADCRLRDAEIYCEWYGEHKDPELLGRAVYGLPEIHREAIRSAALVANPGCYPTTVILGTAPMVNRADVDVDRPIVDAKSGISGAGRGAKLTTSFCEAGEGFKPYGVVGHRHIPEMEQELSAMAGRRIRVRFTPHLIPVTRGMVSTIYLPLKEETSAETLREAYSEYYRSEPFVTVLPAGVFPDTARVRGSNQCHVQVEVDHRTGLVVAMTAIDNLTKGASGTAVQNMNVMMGFEETLGLESLPLFP